MRATIQCASCARMRGLWKRNERYYAQIRVEDAHTGHKKVKRVPLEGATTDPQAIKIPGLKAARRKGRLRPEPDRAPPHLVERLVGSLLGCVVAVIADADEFLSPKFQSSG